MFMSASAYTFASLFVASRRSVVNAALVTACLGLSLAAGGCNGVSQGQFTKAGVSAAQERMNQIKTNVEMDTAQRQLMGGDLEKAQRSIDRVIIANPKAPAAFLLRGRILLEKGEYESAMESLLHAEKLDGQNIDVQYYLGIIAERQNRLEEALTRYTTCSKLDATKPQYMIAAAEMMIQLGKIEEGEALLRDNMDRFVGSAEIRHTLGQLELVRGNWNTAMDLLSQARMLSPNDQMILEDLARAQVAAGKWGHAELNLQALLRDPVNAERTDLKMLQARCLAAMERLAEARTLMGDVLSNDRHSADVQAWITYGHICARLEDPVRLRQAVSRIITLAPERPEGYALRAMLLRMANNPVAALQSIDRAITIQPNDPNQWVIRGLIQAETGQFDLSQQSLSNALKLDPNNANAKMMVSVLAQLNAPGATATAGVDVP
jgi:tetratricopeptide (TPR) repeat protein